MIVETYMVHAVGWVEATVKIVNGLAWPVVVAVAVFVLRKPIGRLIERMSHFKGPGVEADFPSQAAATNELSEEAVPNVPDEMTLPADSTPQQDDGQRPPLRESPSLGELLQEAETHPVGGIVRAWNLVEQVVEHGFPFYLRPYNPRPLMQDLRGKGYISDDVVGLYERLSRLRNEVVHGRTVPTPAAARDFVQATWRLTAALADAANHVPLP